jgi:hypothetical protein
MHIVSSASAAPLASLNDHAASAESTPRIGETREIAEQGPVAAPQPVRTLQLQLAREGEGRVDLRLVEHAGGLSVTVRASDSALTRGLQDNLPELSARLAADKYQTHILLPAANEASTTLAGSSDQPAGKSYEPGGGRNFSQNGAGSGGDGAGRQIGWGAESAVCLVASNGGARQTILSRFLLYPKFAGRSGREPGNQSMTNPNSISTRSIILWHQ